MFNLNMKFRNDRFDGEDDNSYLDETGHLHLLICPSAPWGAGEQKVTFNAVEDITEQGTVSKVTRREVEYNLPGPPQGKMSVNYIGLMLSPVGNQSAGQFQFRRGVDWTYYPGDLYAAWRIDGTKGNSPENYLVNTRDGITYYPTLPSVAINKNEEVYHFGALPATKTPSLYTQYYPISTAGVFMEEGGASKRRSTANGKIAVTSVQWDGNALWNKIDEDYSDDHCQDTGNGDGAGIINTSFTTQDWSATEERDCKVSYLYYNDPKITVRYLRSDHGLMFARSHFSYASHNPAMHPTYGDRLRIFYEIQFSPKRTA